MFTRRDTTGWGLSATLTVCFYSLLFHSLLLQSKDSCQQSLFVAGLLMPLLLVTPLCSSAATGPCSGWPMRYYRRLVGSRLLAVTQAHKANNVTWSKEGCYHIACDDSITAKAFSASSLDHWLMNNGPSQLLQRMRQMCIMTN